MNNNENLNLINESETQNNNIEKENNIDQLQEDNTPQAQIQSELKNIPNVDQDKQSFINNVESMNNEKKEEKKEGINFAFIIILFAIILAAILFLFPFLLNYI